MCLDDLRNEAVRAQRGQNVVDCVRDLADAGASVGVTNRRLLLPDDRCSLNLQDVATVNAHVGLHSDTVARLVIDAVGLKLGVAIDAQVVLNGNAMTWCLLGNVVGLERALVLDAGYREVCVRIEHGLVFDLETSEDAFSA